MFAVAGLKSQVESQGRAMMMTKVMMMMMSSTIGTIANEDQPHGASRLHHLGYVVQRVTVIVAALQTEVLV